MSHWIEVAIFDVILPTLAVICFVGIARLLYLIVKSRNY